MPRLQCSPFGLQGGASRDLPAAYHRRAGEDVAARGLELAGVGVGHPHVIDDAGVRSPQRPDTDGVGLNLLEPFGSHHLEVGYAVGDAALVEVIQASQLALVGGDDHLAARIVLDLVFVAEPDEAVLPAHAEPRLPRAGPVVDAGVDDAAVMTRLVLGQLLLFLDHRHLQVRRAFQQLHGRGQPDDAAAHDGHVVLPLFHRVGTAVVGCSHSRCLPARWWIACRHYTKSKPDLYGQG